MLEKKSSYKRRIDLYIYPVKLQRFLLKETIDDYLKMTRREILWTKGRVTHQQALDKAQYEYEKYKKKQEEQLSTVEKDFKWKSTSTNCRSAKRY